MDENNIQILDEDLTEEFQALARTHTMTIKNLLEEFNDDQLLLMLDTEWDFNDNAPHQLEAVQAQ